MITAIIILSVSLLSVFGLLISCIVHIIKIQKELSDISKEQTIQNKDIRSIATHLHGVTISHNELLELVTKQTVKKYVGNSYFGPFGES